MQSQLQQQYWHSAIQTLLSEGFEDLFDFATRNHLPGLHSAQNMYMRRVVHDMHGMLVLLRCGLGLLYWLGFCCCTCMYVSPQLMHAALEFGLQGIMAVCLVILIVGCMQVWSACSTWFEMPAISHAGKCMRN